MSNQLILAAEDEPVDVMMLKRAFNKAGIAKELRVVGDGDSVLDYLNGDHGYAARDEHPLPVLILLDLKLPRRSGLEVLEWLRQQPRLRRIPVVVLTSSRQNQDVARAYDLGANSYLVKPVDFNALFEMMKTLGLYWLVMNEIPQLDENT